MSLRLQPCKDRAQGWREVATSPRTPKLMNTTRCQEAREDPLLEPLEGACPPADTPISDSHPAEL